MPFPGTGCAWGSSTRPDVRTGSLFPTGRATDTVTTSGGPVTVTLVDAGAPVVIVRAEAVGVAVAETAADLDARADLLALPGGPSPRERAS